ncbi:hypothetical protein Ddc_19745 [Ditylenchus destructor]|nr:hypothetical protein Ddc_19745 [Ditylenchus destructor]
MVAPTVHSPPRIERLHQRDDSGGAQGDNGGTHLPPAVAGSRPAASARTRPARERTRHLADAGLGRARRTRARHGPRLRGRRHDARSAPGRHRREPPPALCRDARRAVAGRDPGAALSGRCRRRIRLPAAERRGRLCHRRGPEQVDKLLEIRPQCPLLSRIWFDDPRGLRHYTADGLASIESLCDEGRAHALRHPGLFETEVDASRADDVAAMFFTSGTTGHPQRGWSTPMPR